MSFDYSQVRDRKFYTFAKPICRPLVSIFAKIKCEGAENIPEKGGFIIACNHIHFIDPGIIIMRCKRPIHFMGKVEAFKNKFAAWFLTHCNCFPVARGRSDKSSVEYASDLIKKGCIIGIFPEGTRSKDLKPKEAKAGVSLIARQTKADILPVSLYSEQAKGLRRKVTIRFGELIKYEELGITEDGSTRELREAAGKIMNEIVDLWEEGHCD